MNTHCLEGIRCPECGSYGPFGIGTHCSAIVHDDGIEETSGHEWDKFSPISARSATTTARWATSPTRTRFSEDEQPERQGAR